MGSRHAGFSSCGSRALEHRLSSCGARAQLLRGMWDLPGPGLEPVSPALAGRLLTTVPPGKPDPVFFYPFLFNASPVNLRQHVITLYHLKITSWGTSLVVQWLRIRLPMQRTWVQSLVWEDPTCHGATKPVRHNCWAHVPQLLKPMHLEPMLRNKGSHHNEKPAHHNKE